MGKDSCLGVGVGEGFKDECRVVGSGDCVGFRDKARLRSKSAHTHEEVIVMIKGSVFIQASLGVGLLVGGWLPMAEAFPQAVETPPAEATKAPASSAAEDSEEAPGKANGEAAESKPLTDEEYFELFREFVDTFEQIDRNYVKEINRKELMHAAIQGMLTELDPYSSYIPPDDLAGFTQGIEQEFGGIGIQVQLDPMSRRLTVVTPLPGTPAYRSGVVAGDIIMEVNGESTEGYSIDDAVGKLKGKPGEEVTIGVLHKGSDKVEQIKLTREVIQVATVLGDRYNADGTWDFMLDDEHKIGYIRVTHFSRRTGDELEHALKQLQADGMKGLVLDLRFNPGGLLTEAIEFCDLFLEKGVIVSTKGRNVPERSWEAKKPGTFIGFPMAVLVNRFSASASEIVSACLQDHERAVIVGERTWGKGSVQNVIDLNGGSSALKLTTASYLRPSGKNIHRFPNAGENEEWGVRPNEGYLLQYSDKDLQDYLLERRDRDVIGETPDAKFEDRQRTLALNYLHKEMGLPEHRPAPQEAPRAEADRQQAEAPAK